MNVDLVATIIVAVISGGGVSWLTYWQGRRKGKEKENADHVRAEGEAFDILARHLSNEITRLNRTHETDRNIWTTAQKNVEQRLYQCEKDRASFARRIASLESEILHIAKAK